MAGVTTQAEVPAYAAPAPVVGLAARKYVTEFIGAFFLTFAGAFAVGGISGGVFNPAVALGGATAGLFGWSTIWVYILVQLAAGVVAGLAFLALNPGDK